jgi:hypothetical protein
MQFCQKSQAVYRELLCIVLASRRKSFNISANFLPRIRSSHGFKWAHRLVRVQNGFNQILHHKPQNIRTAIAAVHHLGFWPSIPSGRNLALNQTPRGRAGAEGEDEMTMRTLLVLAAIIGFSGYALAQTATPNVDGN